MWLPVPRFLHLQIRPAWAASFERWEEKWNHIQESAECPLEEQRDCARGYHQLDYHWAQASQGAQSVRASSAYRAEHPPPLPESPSINFIRLKGPWFSHFPQRSWMTKWVSGVLTLGHWLVSAGLQSKKQKSKSVGKARQRRERRKGGNVRREKMIEMPQAWGSTALAILCHSKLCHHCFISQLFFRQTSASPTSLPFCGFHVINNQSSSKLLLYLFHFWIRLREVLDLEETLQITCPALPFYKQTNWNPAA